MEDRGEVGGVWSLLYHPIDIVNGAQKVCISMSYC